MKNVAIVTGILLVIIGLVGYGTSPLIAPDRPAEEVIAKAPSWTALIPAFIGLPISLCGLWVTFKPSANKIAMHVAATFALLGALVSAWRLIVLLLGFIRAEGEFNQRSFAFLALMGVLCWMFVLYCFLSFFKARRRLQQDSVT